MALNDGVDLRNLVPRTWRAIANANDPVRLVRYGGMMSRIRASGEGLSLEPLSVDRARYEIEMHAGLRFVSVRQDGGEIAKVVPEVLVKTLLAHPNPPIPVLNRIATVPVLVPGPRLVRAPGYDLPSGIYLDLRGLDPIRLQRAPTPSQVARARDFILNNLIVDFPFVGEADRAHAVAALLLPFVRGLITGPTPLHFIEKPSPGSGGTLLAEILLWASLGKDIPRITAARDEDEQRRSLTAKLRGAPVALLFDNVKAAGTRRLCLDSAALSAAITATTWEDRRIGSSELVSVPVSCVWLATGNNPAIDQEIARRSIRIRIDAGVERPELRTGFKHPDLRGWVREHRTQLVVAALTLVQAWIAAGQPQGTKTLGMFERWAAVMGGILDVAGISGFLGNIGELHATTDDARRWDTLVRAWWQRYQATTVRAADLFQIAVGVLELEGKTEDARRMRFGKQLSAHKDRMYAGYKIVRTGTRHNAAAYKLEQVAVPRPPAGSHLQLVDSTHRGELR